MDLKRFEDYEREVIQAYEKKKNEGKLPPNLQRHTPAKLKRECLDEFSNRYRESDNHTFTSLFGKGNSIEEFLKLIGQSDPDIFRPLNNFLRRKTGGTRDTNIELLAWLIDFEPRPHMSADIYEIIKKDRDSNFIKEPETVESEDPKGKSEVEDVIEPEIIIESEESTNIAEEAQGITTIPISDSQGQNNTYFGVPHKFKKSILAFFSALIILGGSFIYYHIIDHQCMYWDGNQYQSIACDQKVSGATIVPLDTASLAHLKRITNISSITINDIGKIYYSKTYGKVEFYTSKGDNPTDNHKRLLPMTKYMYDKYVPHKP